MITFTIAGGTYVALTPSANNTVSFTINPIAHSVPSGGTDGQVLTKTSSTDYATAWETPSGGGGGATNLAYTAGVSSGIVTSDTGTDATIPLADATNAGLITAAEKTKITNTSGTNTGDQTTIVGLTGTKAQFDTAVTDGNILYVGDAPTAHTHPQSDVTNLVTDLGNKQPLDSDLTTIAGLTATTDNFIQSKSSAWASRTVAQVTTDLQSTGLVADTVGFRNIPQNSQSAAYTTVAADSGKHILHPAGDANARTFTIDSNANVAYPIGTAITFINMTAQVVTIAITSDTMNLIGAGTTGSRSLAQYGSATAVKITSTGWVISGVNLT